MYYLNSWDSLNARPVPQWFSDAKFGIFIHWGLYSVPAWAPIGQYAEWYGNNILQEGSPFREFHARTYGNKRYADFVNDFKAELFDADAWAKIFADSGAKYINFVSKHHDGFCMYKTTYAPFWNSVDVGPHRDFAAELKAACEKQQIRFGMYHSVYEWWNPLYLKNPEEYAVKHLIPMLKELIENYQPNTLFTDGEWEHTSDVWHSTEFLQWLYNDSSVRDFIVPNDRWGYETRGAMGGNFTTEYGEVGNGKTLLDAANQRPFEECRGIGRSFGFNRMEGPEDYLSAGELLTLLCSLVSKGGNLLLNIGPAADGTIPAIMTERLQQIGRWLKVNGEAIYSSRPLGADEVNHIYYTKNGNADYAMVDGLKNDSVVLEKLKFHDNMQVQLLGSELSVKALPDENGAVRLQLPRASYKDIPMEGPRVFKVL